MEKSTDERITCMALEKMRLPSMAAAGEGPLPAWSGSRPAVNHSRGGGSLEAGPSLTGVPAAGLPAGQCTSSSARSAPRVCRDCQTSCARPQHGEGLTWV